MKKINCIIAISLVQFIIGNNCLSAQESVYEWFAIANNEKGGAVRQDFSIQDSGVDVDYEMSRITKGRIIHFKGTKNQAEALKNSNNFKAVGPKPKTMAKSFDLPGRILDLETDSRILSDQFGYPNDPYFRYQWHLEKQPFGIGWIAPPTGEFGAEINDVDCGTDVGLTDSSELLTNQTLVSQEYSNLHGTMMSSLIVNKTNNGFGTASVSPNSPMLVWNACYSPSGADLALILKAIFLSADSGAKILMLEFHYPDGADMFTYMLLEEAINYAFSKGMIVVGSCGNERKDQCNAPSTIPGVITVSASNKSGGLINNEMWGSNWQVSGDGATEFCAPAEYMATMSIGGYFGVQDTGTSGAQAIWAGIASRVWGHYPEWTASQVITHMAATANREGVDPRCGYGIPSIAAATATSMVRGRITKTENGFYSNPKGVIVKSDLFGSSATDNDGYFSFSTVVSESNKISTTFFSENNLCKGEIIVPTLRGSAAAADITVICQPAPHKAYLPAIIK